MRRNVIVIGLALLALAAVCWYFFTRNGRTAIEKTAPVVTTLTSCVGCSDLENLPPFDIYGDTIFFYAAGKFQKADVATGQVTIDWYITKLIKSPSLAEDNSPLALRSLNVDSACFYMEAADKDVKISKLDGHLERDRSSWHEQANWEKLYQQRLERSIYPAVIPTTGHPGKRLFDPADHNSWYKLRMDNGFLLAEDSLLLFNQLPDGQTRLEVFPMLPNYRQVRFPLICWATADHFLLYSNDKRNKFYRVSRETYRIEDSVDLAAYIKPPTREQVVKEWGWQYAPFVDQRPCEVRRVNGHYYAVYLHNFALHVVRFDL